MLAMQLKVKVYILLGLLCFAMLSWAENEPVAGRDYQVLDNPIATASKDKVEVIEFFWYGCPHCYQLETYMESWLEDKPGFVDFKYVPAPLGGIWDVHARAFYTAETMGVLDQTHKATFNAIHQEKKTLVNLRQIKDFYASLGVDGDKFQQTTKAFIVDVRLNQAKGIAQAYQLQSVPLIAVNGKYLLSPSITGSAPKIIKVLNYLINKEKALLSK